MAMLMYSVYATGNTTPVKHSFLQQEDSITYLTPGYYLVIGAYSRNSEWYAKRYTDRGKKNGV